MSDILSIDGISPSFPIGRLAPGYAMHQPSSAPDVGGGVAIPRFSNVLRRIVEQSSLRQARVRAIQTEIESGDFETPERIKVTVDRLLYVFA